MQSWYTCISVDFIRVVWRTKYYGNNYHIMMYNNIVLDLSCAKMAFQIYILQITVRRRLQWRLPAYFFKFNVEKENCVQDTRLVQQNVYIHACGWAAM